MPKKQLLCVIRLCCLGPNCSRNHLATRCNTETGKYEDARVWVVQWFPMSDIKTTYEEVAKNWSAYHAKIVSVEEALKIIAPDSAEWLKKEIARIGQK